MYFIKLASCHNRVLLSALILLLCPMGEPSGSALAQEPAPKVFKLKAALSGTAELEPASKSLPPCTPETTLVRSQVASLANPKPDRLPAANCLTGSSPGLTRALPAMTYSEYGVDWSGWVGRVADRWFQALRSLEHRIGQHYQTSRPALIRFTGYPDGRAGDIALVQSSGVAEYDRLQALALVQSLPLPPFPQGTRRLKITLVQGWESHLASPGERDYQPGSFGQGFPVEQVGRWTQLNQ